MGKIANAESGEYTSVVACSADKSVELKGQVVGGIAAGSASRGLKLSYSYFASESGSPICMHNTGTSILELTNVYHKGTRGVVNYPKAFLPSLLNWYKGVI